MVKLHIMSASVTGGELIDRDTAIVRDLDNTAVRLLDPTAFTFGGTRKGKRRWFKSQKFCKNKQEKTIGNVSDDIILGMLTSEVSFSGVSIKLVTPLNPSQINTPCQ